MIEALLKYQEVDEKLRKIEVELSSSEERKKAKSAKKYLDGVEETVVKLDNRSAELNASFNAITDELEKMKEQEEEFVKAMENIADQGSASYLLKKTDEILGRIKVLSQELNRISADIQNVMKEYASVRNNTKGAQAQLTEYGEKYKQLKASKKEEMDGIEKELSKLKKEVDPALMEKYEKKRAEKIFPIVYEIRDNVCGACNMELPMSVLNKLNNGEVVECDFCRRMIYKK